MVSERGIVLRSIESVIRPKSARRAVPLSSMRMFAYLAGQRNQKWVTGVRLYPFEIPMNDPEFVEVGCTGHDLGELKVVRDRKNGCRGETASRRTNCKRFTSGLDLAYSITFPFCIQSETIRKNRGFVETETPNRGKMLGWERRFQLITSRQNRYMQIKQR